MSQALIKEIEELGVGINSAVLIGDELAAVLHAARHSADNVANMSCLIQAGERTLQALDELLNRLDNNSADVLAHATEAVRVEGAA